MIGHRNWKIPAGSPGYSIVGHGLLFEMKIISRQFKSVLLSQCNNCLGQCLISGNFF